jgi:glycogen debranching enzyme
MSLLPPIQLTAQQLRRRRFLLGNKRGFMLYLPVANGATARTLHGSKWYGAYRYGRKFLEGLACYGPDGRIFSRRLQTGFVFDGVFAQRFYALPRDGVLSSAASSSAAPVSVTECYFVPDFLPGLIWWQSGRVPLTVEPRFDFRFYRGAAPSTPYQVEQIGDIVVVSREVPIGTDEESAPPPGGELATARESMQDLPTERLWAACAVRNGEIRLRPERQRWQAVWYGADAARRSYLRQFAARTSGASVPWQEHTPRWEQATAMVYVPLSIASSDDTVVAFGFGNSREEALQTLRQMLGTAPQQASHPQRRRCHVSKLTQLEQEKRQRLRALLEHSAFRCGDRATDMAYQHVLSRLIDGLVAEGLRIPGTLLSVPSTVILAGNAYFQEAWKRDENIAIGGLLATGQYEMVGRVLDDTWQRQDPETGRLPLRLRGGEVLSYTSSDGTLWALWRLAQYIRQSGDYALLETKLPLVLHFFRRSLQRCWQGLLPSGGIAVPGYEWETWMDTEFSPRAGYPIEIQFLWLACLRVYTSTVANFDRDLAAEMEAAAHALERSLELFRHGDYLIDHLTYALEPVNLFTPNAFFWTVLGIDLGWEFEERMLALARAELAGVSGVRTLARSQWASVLQPEIVALARPNRPLPSVGKINYHRGVEWNWLAQFFVAGELKHGRPDVAFDRYLARQVHDATAIAGLGGVSELFDHRGPAGPDFQAWSMSGLLEALHRFVGVDIDVPARRISFRPQKPQRWPLIQARKWFGSLAFDVEYTTGSAIHYMPPVNVSGAPVTRTVLHRQRHEQLTITFASSPPAQLELVIEFVLPLEATPHQLLLSTGEGEPQSLSWVELAEPRRIQVRLPAQQRQQLWLSA